MPYVCQLTNLTDSIDLQYNALGFSLLDRGIQIGHPQRVSLYGGRLELELVRTEDGKRYVPLALDVKGSSGQDLIDRVNALEAMLRDAASYHCHKTGAEVFLNVKIDDALEGVLLPVLEGEINTNELYSKCSEPYDLITKLPVMVTCEPYWEADATGTLENYIDNPGFWRGAAPGDSWAEANGGDVTSTIDPDVWEVMGRSLKQVYIVDAVNDTGVISDAQTVVASTEYYFEARNYRAAGCDVLTAQVYDASNFAPIAASVLTFNGATGDWVKDGVAFTTPVGCVSVQIELYCLAADSVAAGTAYWDAIYLEPRSDAPTGWSSGRNLVNHLDTGAGHADHLNVVCVTEIPGEVEAECDIVATYTDAALGVNNIYVAQKVGNDPSGFVWQFTPCGMYTTAEGGAGGACTPGYTDVLCIDSDKIVDANAPSGSRIEVDFATDQTMRLRCHFSVTADFENYRGTYQLAVLCKKAAGADTVKMKMRALQDVVGNTQGYVVSRTVQTEVDATAWGLLSGWQILSFPIGQHGDTWDTGNRWRIELYASISGGAAWDALMIGGACLVPLDSAYLICESPTYSGAPAGIDYHIKDMDGERGVFPYDSTNARYYSSISAVGAHPQLAPTVENWLYWAYKLLGATLVITPTLRVALTYRPRGKFLRGSNP